MDQNEFEVHKNARNKKAWPKKLDQWDLLYGQNRFFCSDSQTQGRIFFMSLAHVRKQVKFGCLGEGEEGARGGET